MFYTQILQRLLHYNRVQESVVDPNRTLEIIERFFYGIWMYKPGYLEAFLIKGSTCKTPVSTTKTEPLHLDTSTLKANIANPANINGKLSNPTPNSDNDTHHHPNTRHPISMLNLPYTHYNHHKQGQSGYPATMSTYLVQHTPINPGTAITRGILS